MGFFRDLFFGTSEKSTKSSIPKQPTSPFEIVNGVLKRYMGSEARVVIPEGVTMIDERAFFGLLAQDGRPQNYIQEVIFPNGLVEIGRSAFYNCTKLSSVKFPFPNTVKKISDDAFAGCTSLTMIPMPEGIEEIGRGAFARSGIQSFSFPSTIKMKELPSQLFRACPNLSRVYIRPTFLHIGVAAFAECRSLKGIHIPEGVIDIAGAAFSDCYALQSVELPRTLREIEETAFENSHPTLYVHLESKVMDVIKRRGWKVSVIMDLKTKLFSLDGTYCINHKMENADWPLLASNGTIDLFTQKELVEAYIRKSKRKIEVCYIPKPFLEAYLKSWYAKGIRKIMVDDHKYELLSISELLDDSAFPETLHPTLELARTLVAVKQCEEDDEQFLAGIIGENVQNMLPKTVFLTLLKKGTQKTEGLACSSLVKELMERTGVTAFPGLEAYDMAEPSIKHEDMQTFQYEGKTVAYLFTDMNELKRVAGEDSTFGIVAYGDVVYRILHQESCGELNAGIINPAGLKCWIYG